VRIAESDDGFIQQQLHSRNSTAPNSVMPNAIALWTPTTPAPPELGATVAADVAAAELREALVDPVAEVADSVADESVVSVEVVLY
jgi:hypothetical protein